MSAFLCSFLFVSLYRLSRAFCNNHQHPDVFVKQNLVLMVEVASLLILGCASICFSYVPLVPTTALPRQPGKCGQHALADPTLGRPRDGVCHSLAAPAFGADGVTQSHVPESHWHPGSQNDKCQQDQDSPSGNRPSDPVWSGDLSVKNWLIFLLIFSSRLKG